MITLAHLSDIHLAPLPPVRAMDLLNKRITGYLNWRLRRHNTLAGSGLANLMRHMREQHPDMVAVTGDLVNLGLEAEAKGVLDQKIPGAARLHFLAILALDPTNRGAFEALRERAPDAPFITHTVKSGDTLKGLAELYYGTPLRADAIAATNGLSVDAALAAGRTLRIPELPGIPLLPR